MTKAATPKRSYTSAVLQLRCPRCREGKLFKSVNLFIKPGAMNETCACCGLSFRQEPGFYYGAMYVSYGIGTAIFLTLFISMQVVYSTPVWLFLSLYIFLILISMPVSFRLSRAVWLSLFIRYRKDAIQEYKELTTEAALEKE